MYKFPLKKTQLPTPPPPPRGGYQVDVPWNTGTIEATLQGF
jgi:hypothetical protein